MRRMCWRAGGIAPYNWQTSASVQHELRPGLAVNVGYFRTWYGNFQVTDNVLVTPADFDPFCITAPVDARLPNGGGYQICDGLSNVNPSKFGLVENVVTQASHFGNRREVYNGVDATVNWRFGEGGLLQGHERRAHGDRMRHGGCAAAVLQKRPAVFLAAVQILRRVPPAFLGPQGERDVPKRARAFHRVLDSCGTCHELRPVHGFECGGQGQSRAAICPRVPRA
jgi:hypothetical protein